MTEERTTLAAAMKAVTDRAPLITRGVVNAQKISNAIGWRKNEFSAAITQTRALLDELMLHQVRLGWRDRGDDAA
jgi:ABC-type transporter Mla subunit MlaD